MSKQISRRQFLLGTGSLMALGYLSWLGLMPGIISAGNKNGTGKPGTPAGQSPPLPEPVECDLVFRSGLIIDGRGDKAYSGSVGIKGKQITAVGDFQAAPGAVEIDARGLVLCPGFIDVHSHTEQYLAAGGRAEMLLLQGVTTHLGGNCGTSVDRVGSFLGGIHKLAINLGILAGYKHLRQAAVAREGRQASAGEVAAMQDKLAVALQEGAFGLSVGLEYWPQTLATTRELVELCQVLKQYGGFYATHIRSESDRVLEAVEEALEIGHQASVPVQYSHIKTSFQRNWGKMKRVLGLLDDARQGGLDVTADVYGYTFSSWDLGSKRHSISEDDLILALQHPAVMIGSDSGLDNLGRAVHPRAYGNYPHILRTYVLDKGVISLEQAIHKMTAMPARRMELKDRGLLVPGYKADVVAFDPGTIASRATRANPNRLAAGVRWVLVNGQVAVKDGQLTGCSAGEVLRRA
ncbi:MULTISPECIES: N-acyl-D-amino-acid deacylase family protein [unclassified Neomoorella]|jgi:N-acyl-D-amino-acid deacylase|uniref:N-acyl-D-amino-acid deacylase family protein n=1 Tax=unclassified Neomoorella TaxID=2676739 RepID=UPI0011425E88|nr:MULTISPECIES: D-aminoacylase [unclassified Moorella (in: firmicutes)]